MPFSAARARKSASPSRTVAITGPDANSTASEISESACSSSWWTITIVRFGSSRAISSAASRTDTANGMTSWPRLSSVTRSPSQRALVLVGDEHAQVRFHSGRSQTLNPPSDRVRMLTSSAQPPAAAFLAPQQSGVPGTTYVKCERRGAGVHRRSSGRGGRGPRSIFGCVQWSGEFACFQGPRRACARGPAPARALPPRGGSRRPRGARRALPAARTPVGAPLPARRRAARRPDPGRVARPA